MMLILRNTICSTLFLTLSFLCHIPSLQADEETALRIICFGAHP
ncbi:MAG TPA: GlcNAc-PI de-N-acetylase, partial [Planctomycetaceae bacterium]|nr:GlcNAc-PI de-N-acetylase [Planctomycetaceae bacterium]